MFKIVNGFENIDSNIFSSKLKKAKITKGHNILLVKEQSRLDVRKYAFSQRTINVWDKLSTDCVQASSVNMFKNKIDKYIVKAGYNRPYSRCQILKPSLVFLNRASHGRRPNNDVTSQEREVTMMLRHNLRTDAQICGKSASQASLFVRHGRGVNRVY